MAKVLFAAVILVCLVIVVGKPLEESAKVSKRSPMRIRDIMAFFDWASRRLAKKANAAAYRSGKRLFLANSIQLKIHHVVVDNKQARKLIYGALKTGLLEGEHQGMKVADALAHQFPHMKHRPR